MEEVEIKLKEVLVRSIIKTRDAIGLTAVIAVKNTKQNVDVTVEFGLPQDMTHTFFKRLRETQQKPTPASFYSTPSDFIQVIKFQDYEIVEKKMLMFFGNMWHELRHIRSHKSLAPKTQKVEEIRNMRMRL